MIIGIQINICENMVNEKNDHGNDAEHYKFIGGYLVTNMVQCPMKHHVHHQAYIGLNCRNNLFAIENMIISRRFTGWNAYLKIIMDCRRTIGKLNLEPRIEFGHCLGTWTANIGSISNGTINVVWRNWDFLWGQGKFNVYLHKIGYRYKSSCFCGNTNNTNFCDFCTKFWNKEFNRFKIIVVQTYCGLRSKIGPEIDEDRLVRSSCNHDTSWRKNPIFDDFQIVHYT
ncbi:WD repeat-containing protein 36 [Dermatophagoides farinae]|uniref:WD repeat-containing protein 36 n=1 Tax=Dermatophagoides farinae TaxID=6954 RepID=A0A922L2P6_DERFA|nr:WD repeat-containing protein 36 [Dermatophagoides farinae]